MSVDPGISTTDARVKGFEDAVEGRLDVHLPRRAVLAQRPGHGGLAGERRAAEGPRHRRHLRHQPVRRRGLRHRHPAGRQEDQVKIVGFDAGPDQIKALKAGTVQALVAQQPGTIGPTASNQAIACTGRRRPVTPKIQTGFTIITKDNVDTSAAGAVYKSNC